MARFTPRFWTSMSDNGRTATMAAGMAVFMAGLGWASVPLYDLFCRVTGFGGTTMVGTGADRVLERTVTVRFDASRAHGMPWEFRPVQRTMEVQIGQDTMAWYEAYNPTDQVTAGTASYNVAPYAAGPYFFKIDCFCFTHQVLQPGERMLMPVNFYIDPEMVDSTDAGAVHTITLSYTFHNTELDPAVLASYSAAPATEEPARN